MTRDQVLNRTASLINRLVATPELAVIKSDLFDKVRSNNPELQKLEGEIVRLKAELWTLQPPGLCVLIPNAVNEVGGGWRELDASVLYKVSMRADKSSLLARSCAADVSKRFLLSKSLSLPQTKTCASSTTRKCQGLKLPWLPRARLVVDVVVALLVLTFMSDGAKIRRVAARIMRDFQGTILEGAQERLAELQPELVKEGGMLYPPNRAQAFWEVRKARKRLLKMSQA